MKRTINTIIFLCAAVAMLAQNSFIVADKNGNSQLVQSLIFQRNAANDQFSWKTYDDTNGYQKDRDIKDLLFIARVKEELSTGSTNEVVSMLEELSGTDNADATAVAAALKDNPNVVEAFSEDGNNVAIRFNADEGLSFYPLYSQESLFSESDFLEEDKMAMTRAHKASSGSSNSKVAIFNFFNNNPLYYSQDRLAKKIRSWFRAAGYDVDEFGPGADNAFTQSALEGIFDINKADNMHYKAIFVFTHGALKNGDSYICTNELAQKNEDGIVDPTDYQKYKIIPVKQTLRAVRSGHIVYLGACDSAPKGGYDANYFPYTDSNVIGWSGRTRLAQAYAALMTYLSLYGDYSWSDIYNSLPKHDNSSSISISYGMTLYGSFLLFSSGLTKFDYNEDISANVEKKKTQTYKKDCFDVTINVNDDRWRRKVHGYVVNLATMLENKTSLKKQYITNSETNNFTWVFPKELSNNNGLYILDIVEETNLTATNMNHVRLRKPVFIIKSDQYRETGGDIVSEEDITTPIILDENGEPLDSIALSVGSSKTFTVDSYEGHLLSVPILDKEIVTASIIGNQLTINGLSEGTTYLGVYDKQNKKIAIAEVTVTAGENTDSEPYAALSDGGKTVTFYYDNKKTIRGGMDINEEWGDDNSSPYGTATKAVIDASFANYHPTSTSYWFGFCGSLATITGLENLKTDKVISMGRMFFWCHSLKTIDVSSFNTENVVSMSGMFDGCASLTTLNVSNFKTDNVNSMENMFDGCTSLTTLDLSNFKTNKVTDMGYMFQRCSSLTSINLSSFETFRVNSFRYMFSGCSELKALDLSSFRTDNITIMDYMFSDCSNLTTIYVDENKWNTEGVDGGGMFLGCNSLVGGNGTKYSEVWETNEGYARVDQDGAPGYFTAKNGVFEYVSCPDSNHPHMIDLGLPSGTKWACCNVGASKPEDYGEYYAWGETIPRSINDYSYNWDLTNGVTNISGTSLDVAYVKWGSSWHIPSHEQIEELCNSTTHKGVVVNGVEGCEFMGDNGKTIFLPTTKNAYDYGLYWSSEYDGISNGPWYLRVDPWGGAVVFADSWGMKNDALSVRPVSQ